MSFNVECTVIVDPIAAPTSTNAVAEHSAVEDETHSEPGDIHCGRGPRDLSVSQ